PGIGPPLFGVFGNCASLQHALASALVSEASASSNVIRSRPSRLKAAEPVMRGTHWRSHASALTRPPGSPFLQPVSCPSWQRFGVMKLKFAVLFGLARSAGSRVSGTSLAAQDGVSMIEWKYTNGLWRAAYWSVAVAFCVPS